MSGGIYEEESETRIGCTDNDDAVKDLFVDSFSGCSDFMLALNGIYCWKPFTEIDSEKFKDANEARGKYDNLAAMCGCFCIPLPTKERQSETAIASRAASIGSLKSVNSALRKALKAALN